MTSLAPATIYRTDIVGSLLRPPALIRARQAHEAGEIDRAALRVAEDAAILDAIRLQEAVGLAVVNDGELRRKSYLHSFFDAVSGCEEDARVLTFRNSAGEHVPVPNPGIVDRLRKVANPALAEAEFVRQHTNRPVKVTLPGPSLAEMYTTPRTWQVYRDREELRADLIGIIQALARELVDAGVPYIQVDAPQYTAYCDPSTQARLRGKNLDPMRLLAQDIASDNAAIADLRERGVTWGLHLCRGNFQSSWSVSGGYEPIAERAFNETHYDTLLLEYDSERAGGFEPLRFVPPDKVVVLGLVTTKRPTMEDPDALARRIAEAARYVPLDRLTLSPQCGFASVVAGNKISPEAQRAKLELVVRVARRVWGD